jgi:hypothetical protein
MSRLVHQEVSVNVVHTRFNNHTQLVDAYTNHLYPLEVLFTGEAFNAAFYDGGSSERWVDSQYLLSPASAVCGANPVGVRGTYLWLKSFTVYLTFFPGPWADYIYPWKKLEYWIVKKRYVERRTTYGVVGAGGDLTHLGPKGFAVPQSNAIEMEAFTADHPRCVEQFLYYRNRCYPLRNIDSYKVWKVVAHDVIRFDLPKETYFKDPNGENRLALLHHLAVPSKKIKIHLLGHGLRRLHFENIPTVGEGFVAENLYNLAAGSVAPNFEYWVYVRWLVDTSVTGGAPSLDELIMAKVETRSQYFDAR